MGLTKNFTELRHTDVTVAGGKGASLGEMTNAGIPVPSGFVILASAFDQFLTEADLVQEIDACMDRVNYQDVASIERASATIQALIHAAVVPVALAQEIQDAFSTLDAEFVAVRSSATAEDSSQASWAGELESYLNTTQDQLLHNIKKCWASLFTPRAIVYRNEKGMKDTHVSVAVVIQKMVQSEVAGIAFTVHPVTEDPNQMIIEACWGLGELIVGGMVTPDSYVIDKRDWTIIDCNISEQQEMLVRGSSGNTKVAIATNRSARQKLNESQIIELVRLSVTIERQYGFPCDIEWAMEDGKFFIVQSRPITTLLSSTL